ncbi:MAG: sulfotransferase [Candidatus Hydrogenedentota bacterium]
MRALVMAWFVPLLGIGQAIHRMCLALDTVLFPGFRKVDVSAPVLMMGIPRSGTTFLHRVLSKDTDTFTTFSLWELMFAPSIVERKMFLGLAVIDKTLGGSGQRLLRWADRRFFAEVRKIHHVSLFEPEEDDLVLFPIFGSLFLLFPFPFEEELWHYARFDTETPRAERERIMRFYRECVQRHLYVHGTDKIFLSKNPTFSSKVDSLRETFPDARLICNVRTPYEAAPSLLSFLTFSWRKFRNDDCGFGFRDMILKLTGYWYRWPMERLPKWPDFQHEFVLYDELRARPREVVEELYERFGLSISPRFHAVLDEEEARAQAYESRHEYSLEQYSLSEDSILEQYEDVFEYYGFDKRRVTEDIAGTERLVGAASVDV